MIRFRCPCGKKLKADESIIGRKVKCAVCGKINTVPPQSTATASKARKRKDGQTSPAVQPEADEPALEKPFESATDLAVNPRQEQVNASSRLEDLAHANSDPSIALENSNAEPADVGSPAPLRLETPSAEFNEPKRKRKLEFRQPAGGVPDPPKPTTPPKPIVRPGTQRRGPKPSSSEPMLAGPPDDSQSLLSSSDGSSGRFKAPPELDPDPSEELIGVQDDFADVLADVERNDSTVNLRSLEELDIESLADDRQSLIPGDKDGDAIEIDTEFEPQFKLKSGGTNRKTLLLFVAALAVLVVLLGLGYLIAVSLFSGPPSYPAEFEKLAEVQRFRVAVINYEKSRRQYKVAGELVFKTKGGSEEEIQAYRDFLETTKQPTVDETLQAAFALFPDSVNEAKKLLQAETNKLDSEGPKILLKAIEFDRR